MCDPSGTEPIEDGEILYRRIPASTNWYSPESKTLSSQAFDPRKDDTTGVSLSRAKYKSLADAAKGMSKSGYYVASCRAGDMRAAGIEIEPRPLLDDPSHSELPQLRVDNRSDDETLERMSQLADLFKQVDGPFFSRPSA